MMTAYDFIESWNDVATEVHAIARDKGFWDNDRNNGEALALVISEVCEGLEALRHGNPADDKIPEFTGIEAELADVVIRIMDLSEARGWRVAEAVLEKLQYNKGRERLHGKKF
jgi:NTP pyrophosphatase (non-canonical NTP hydrolase)